MAALPDVKISRRFTDRKLGRKKGVEFVASGFLLLSDDFGNGPHVELKRIMAVEVEYVKQTHISPENGCGSAGA